MRRLFVFIRDLVHSREIVFELTKNDFRARFLGSYLGLLWAFVQPVVTIGILWFVFEVGFKSRTVDTYPFILWIVCGMVPWFFFSDSIVAATPSITEKSFLVSKVVFRVSILPIIKVLSALAIHLFLVAVMFLMFVLYGYPPSIHALQFFYYLFSAAVLIIGVSWITSSLVVFLKDLGQIVGILIQFLFWMTPIFWSTTILPEKYQILVKLNPVYYITQGYRESFLQRVWFWEHWQLTIYYWIVTSAIFFLGTLLFSRLRPHFADVL